MRGITCTLLFACAWAIVSATQFQNDEELQNAILANSRRAVSLSKPFWTDGGRSGAGANKGPTSSSSAPLTRSLLQSTEELLPQQQDTIAEPEVDAEEAAAGSIGRDDPATAPVSTLPSGLGTKQLDALIRIADALDPSQAFLLDWKYNATLAKKAEITYYCRWQGVVCAGSSNNVQEIRLVGRRLNGTLPPGNALEELPALVAIELTSNSLTSSLPASWGSLQLQGIYLAGNLLTGELPDSWANLDLIDLELGLAQGDGCLSNKLSGPLPAAWAKMQRLAYLSLACNQLSGPLPSQWGQLKTRTLYLHDNQISGNLSLDLQNMTKVEILALHSNQLSGKIPQWTGFPSLRFLFAGRNALSGPAADISQLAALKKLEVVTLQQNAFSGPLSNDLGESKSIQGLYLRGNQITGPLPAWGGWQSLQTLVLSDNPLATSLGESWSQLSNLRVLVMINCALTGQLPSTWGSGMSKLTQLVLSNNLLPGPLPLAWFIAGAFPQLSLLNLANNRLSGSMPGTYGLASLQTLVLTSNSLTGELPSALSSLPVRQLHLGKNKFSSTLPAQWGTGFSNLTTLTMYEGGNIFGGLPDWSGLSLERLNLRGNRLSGTLPERLFKNASSLALNDNAFEGTVPFSSWASLKKLSQLDLSHNKLTGTISPAIGEMTSLQGLALNNNQLSGELPPALAQLTWLRVVLLNDNKFTGAVSEELRSWKRVVLVRLDSNRLSGLLPVQLPPENKDDPLGWWNIQEMYLHNNSFTGRLPDVWSNMFNLKTLSLHSNSFGGRIPEQWAAFKALSRLYLSNNQLTGPLPESLGQVKSLTDVRITNNRLSGVLPWNAANLTRLHTLWLSGNSFQTTLPQWPILGKSLRSLRIAGRQGMAGSCISRGGLTGAIPAEWANTMTQLQYLYLGCQQLTGPLPELSEVRRLQELHLQHNQLTGGLPDSWGSSLSSLTELMLNNNDLDGSVPYKLFDKGLQRLKTLSLHHNAKLEGCLPKRLQARLTKMSSNQMQEQFWAATRISGFCKE